MIFGQIVVGLPGSGKTTYCKRMAEYLQESGRRVEIVNLDPANQMPPYKSDISLSELVTLSDVMSHLEIGPNGSFIYCMELLEANIDWLLSRVKGQSGAYFIFDCPGQIELYTHHQSMRNICKSLVRSGLRLAAVQLMDYHFCGDPAKFISGTMASLCAMLHLELPHVNVLSKVDLAGRSDTAHCRLDTYTEVLELDYLLESLHTDPLTQKFGKLNKCLTELIHSFSLVSFKSFDIRYRDSYSAVMEAVDRANGYVYNKQ